jgi:iron complex outermembrane receptor protein
MKKEKKIVILKVFVSLMVLLCVINVYAQQNDSVNVKQLKALVITSNRLQNFTPDNKIQTIDSVALWNNLTNCLTDVISLNSQVHINSYGTGAASYSSIRGTGSAHTAILWNGFNMQDVLNGEVDFSQIPVFFLDDVKIQYGGCGALYGSGAIGGAIHLNNTLPFDQGIKTSLITSYGSFSNYFEGAECEISEKNYAGLIRVFDHSVENDFEFINTYQGNVKQKLENAQTKQQGALIDNSVKINEKQKVNFHLWFQNNDHNIPAIMIDTKSKQNEKNQFLRRSIEWSYIGEQSEMFLRTGYFNNYQYFEDPLYNIKSSYTSVSSINEFENNYKFNTNFKLNSGINYTHEKGTSPNLDKTHVRDRSTIFTSLKYNTLNNALNAVVSLREEVINNNSTPVTYSVGFDGVIIKGFDFKGNLNKSYRIPSFNDLYWNDIVWNMYGNPNLKNEEGLNEEIGLNYKSAKNKFSYESGVTAFNSNVTNWIIWEPVDNYTKWTPLNVDTVWSRGVEYNLDLAYRTNKIFIKFSGMYTLIKTTNESKSADSTVIHKQLIYVPGQKIAGTLFLAYKKYSFAFTHNYIGKRFTDPQNTAFVKSYNISNLVISKDFSYKNYRLNLNFHINNIWNETYQVMEFYPMSLRNYEVGLRLSFNKPDK